MKLYHGSPHLFDTFDFDRIGENGRLEGPGVYFTPMKSIAEAYAGEDGYIYTVDWHGKKTLNSTHHTLSARAIYAIMKGCDVVNDYLSNYGDKTFTPVDKILRMALLTETDTTDSDLELISSIATATGDLAGTLSIVHHVTGCDHTIVAPIWGQDKRPHDVYIAFTPDAFTIESVTKQTKGDE